MMMTRHGDGNGRIEESEFHELLEDIAFQQKRREARSKVRKREGPNNSCMLGVSMALCGRWDFLCVLNFRSRTQTSTSV